MQIRNGIIEAIGNTPLIKLERASQATGCTILGKAEFMNPGQSVKDRPALHIILEAEKRGEIRPGGLVVESTAGNTGIGLALVANARGYRTLIVIPETQSQEKKDMLRLAGAELVEVPAVPYSDPNNYQHIGRTTAPRTSSRPGRKSGGRQTARWTASSAPSAPAARWPACRPICSNRSRAS
jgi:cysteine synthase